MESRDGQKEVAGTSWIAIEECEKDSGCGTTTKRRDEKMMLHITMANPTDDTSSTSRRPKDPFADAPQTSSRNAKVIFTPAHAQTGSVYVACGR
jgi:hypothetical protein